jgi:hypothetical protein
MFGKTNSSHPDHGRRSVDAQVAARMGVRDDGFVDGASATHGCRTDRLGVA